MRSENKDEQLRVARSSRTKRVHCVDVLSDVFWRPVAALWIEAGIRCCVPRAHPEPSRYVKPKRRGTSETDRSVPRAEASDPAILRGFVHYEIVGMSEAHGQKDVDDFILTK